LAGPWTISRDRRDGESRPNFGAVLGRIGAWSRQRLLIRNPGVLFRPAARVRPVRRPIRARRAVPLLAVMTAAAVFLGWATVSLARTGLATTEAAARLSGGPLVAPAPRTAGLLPRRFGASIDPASASIAAQVQQRFAAVGARLIAAGAGQAGRKVTAITPSGVYGEPGHLDPVTNRSAWILYFGFDATGKLGQPGATVTSLMMGILGRWSKIGPWRVPAGHRGGAANCTVAWLASTSVAVCGWATDRTMGVIASPVRDTGVRELATLLLKMRYDLQQP
jgi:hypothetical protein